MMFPLMLLLTLTVNIVITVKCDGFLRLKCEPIEVKLEAEGKYFGSF